MIFERIDAIARDWSIFTAPGRRPTIVGDLVDRELSDHAQQHHVALVGGERRQRLPHPLGGEVREHIVLGIARGRGASETFVLDGLLGAS